MKALQEIEKLLGIKLEQKLYGDSYDRNQKNTYSIRKEKIESLRLDDVVIDDFSKLLPYLSDLHSFELVNSTIPNFSVLLNLSCYNFDLDNVTFKNNNCDIIGKIPGHLQFFNMKFDAAVLRCFKKTNILGFVQVEFKNCHIDNIQYLDDIEPISLLILDWITYTYKPKKSSKKKTRRLSIYNSKLKDLSFLPFKKSLGNLEFENCKIGSLNGLAELPKLRSFSIDSDTRIKDKTVLENKNNQKIYCEINQAKRAVNLEMIVPLKNHINDLGFTNFKGKSIDFIGEFKKIKQLSFEDSDVYIDAFLPIAGQIKTISFRNVKVKKYSAFKHFKKLRKLEINNHGDDGRNLRSYKKIYPLKNQLKVLDICDFEKIKDGHLMADFKSLESLKVGYSIPVKTAEYILTLKNLKRLSLSTNYKKGALNLEKLKNLEYLILDTDMKFVGFEYLKKLKSLRIGEDMSSPNVDINSLPEMKHLKRLNVTNYECKLKGIQQFPNLEYLRIKGAEKIKIQRHEKLKVLDLTNSKVSSLLKIEELPNLEKLDLSHMYCELSLEGMHKFPNLKELSLSETDISDISHLEPLKKLELLDLYYTAVTDARVLNTLPSLKEVNVATYNSVELEKQMDKPNLAVYCGMPRIYLSIWWEDEFGV